MVATRTFIAACCIATLVLGACGQDATNTAQPAPAVHASSILEATLTASDATQEGHFDPALLEASDYRCAIDERYFADIERILSALDQSAQSSGDDDAHYFMMIVVRRADQTQRLAFSSGNDKILYGGTALRTDYDVAHAIEAIGTASCGEAWWH